MHASKSDQYLPTSASRLAYQKNALRNAYQHTLDRVNVLGNETRTYGHTGISCSVRLWRLHHDDSETPYPYKCDTVLHTGHRSNIFNAKLLPSSSRIATVARDRQVRVLDIESTIANSRSPVREMEYTSSQTCIKVFRCHTGPTKRIVTEESPDSFLTVSEDGTVRQHDLRVEHQCGNGTCPRPLVDLPHELSTLSLSPLTPHQFVVGGESPHGYLFDRRQIGRVLKEEWGVVCDRDDIVPCVRRFGRQKRATGELRGTEHVTGVKMARNYSGDAVCLYSTLDDPVSSERQSSLIAPNSKSRTPPSLPMDASDTPGAVSATDSNEGDSVAELDAEMEDFLSRNKDAEVESDGGEDEELEQHFKTPIVLPRVRYTGACNVRTVKNVNFLGPDDEYVAAGSDDGNFFIWEKVTGNLHGIYEGDSSVVNVIEGHPRIPLVCVSGIDTTVKLFAPTSGKSLFSRVDNVEKIISTNRDSSSRSMRSSIGFATLFLQYRLALSQAQGENVDTEDLNSQCTHQ
ncbi:WD40 repeat-like protein [Rickenella mellea]|uniref:WD40 repeat-like protein n=1 Tax=Rickenella mellea TaxID=50990 RepID=A0A4R5XF22_9AGAM|nr:WD40 repeat-like protein [Rickenella mellea]